MKKLKKLNSSRSKFTFSFGKRLVLIGLGIIIGGTALLVGRTNILAINNVQTEIKNAKCISDQQVKTDSKIIGKKIFSLDERQMIGLKNKYPCIADIKIERQFPKTVKLVINGRVPFVRVGIYQPVQPLSLDSLDATASSQAALINWSLPIISEKQFLLADTTGRIFSNEGKIDLPTLLLPEQSLKIGQQLNENLFSGLGTILAKFNGMQFPILTSDSKSQEQDIASNSSRLIVNESLFMGPMFIAKVDGDSLIIIYPQRVIFSLSNNILRQLASLQLILQKAKIEGKAMETIDLRFENPVVKYAPSKKK